MLAILVGEEDAAVPVDEGEGDVGLLTEGFRCWCSFCCCAVSANDVDLIILLKKEEKEKGYCQHSQKNKSEPLIIYDPTMIQPLPTALLMANAVRCGKAQKC